MSYKASHENYSRKEEMTLAPNRHFGVTMAAAGLIFASISFYFGHYTAGLTLLCAALFFLAAAYCFARVLTPLNRAWMALGIALHSITNPIFMLLIYLIAFVPMGIIFKILGKDPLHRKLEKDKETYWVKRDPGPAPDTMKLQF